MSAISARRAFVYRILSVTVLTGVFAAGAAFSFFTLFSRFLFYDDEGKMLLYLRHFLDGDALYDRLKFIYGPAYVLGRWVVFGWAGVPLTNDGVRAVTWVTWMAAAWLMAATARRLARDTGYAWGLAALVWLCGIFHLFVLSNEPGHPQELVVLLLAAAFWIATALFETRRSAALILLGAIAGALWLTKINVGVLFSLGLGVAIVSIGPRPSVLWTLLRTVGALAALALPTFLMRARFADGYGAFCFLITAALLPCCLFAVFRAKSCELGGRQLLECVGGGVAAGCVAVGFALTRGNTLTGIARALVIEPYRGFAVVKYGWPPDLPRFISLWSLAGAICGLAVFCTTPRWRRFLWPLRVPVCAAILGDALLVHSPESLGIWVALPFTWLLLVPSTGVELTAGGWFVRLLLAFTTCLQPIQVFPFPGSQIHIGTFATMLVAVVLLADLNRELCRTEFIVRLHAELPAPFWNLLLGIVALGVGGQAAWASAETYESRVPLPLRGCRWTRFPEKEAALMRFVTANVEASADCVLARIGLMSLTFWTDRPPVGTFVPGNEWEALDPPTNEILLSSYGARKRLMFIDNPRPWYLESHNLEFSKFVAAQPSHAFLDFIAADFKQLARVGSCRLLVRKERHDLDLFDCAYPVGNDPKRPGRSLLRVKLPVDCELTGVASLELVDLDRTTRLGSTDFGSRAEPIFLYEADRELFGFDRRPSRPISLRSDQPLFLGYPTPLRLEHASYPAIRVFDRRGKRVLTLPVAVETCLEESDPH